MDADNINIALGKVTEKIKHYCAYQERCHSEVREKLRSFGLKRKDVEDLVAQLIEENYLNEERFALAFARGKFRMKQWGKQKIKSALQQKHISQYCIRKALDSIGEADYRNTFDLVANKKFEQIGDEENLFLRKGKVREYLFQKGFETDLISEWMRKS